LYLEELHVCKLKRLYRYALFPAAIYEPISPSPQVISTFSEGYLENHHHFSPPVRLPALERIRYRQIPSKTTISRDGHSVFEQHQFVSFAS
jgi:hypothetical protein